MDYNNWSFLKRFTFFNLLAVLFLGVIILWGNVWFVKKQLVAAAARYSEAWTNSVIRYQFQSTDFKKGVDGARFESLNQYFQNHVLNHQIKRIKVWNKDGLIIFSDSKHLIGKKFAVAEDLAEALEGKPHAEFTEMNREENATEKNISLKMLEVYVPIYDTEKGSIIGAFELYVNDQPLLEQLRYNYVVILFAVLGSLTIFYMAPIGIIKKISKTLSDQSSEINSLNHYLDDLLTNQEKAHIGTIKALLATLNAKDNYTAGHSIRVAEYSVLIGKKMGLSHDRINILEESALFHDIGKIGISEAVLNKPGKFTEEEYLLMKKHPIIGAEIIGSIVSFKDHANIIRYHHERIDGTGYPDGLKGTEIPVEAKILAVADSYDALTTDRPYRKGKSPSMALKIINEVRGTQLDDEVVKYFEEAIEDIGEDKLSKKTHIVCSNFIL